MPRPRALMAAGGVPSAVAFIAYYRVSTVQQGHSGLGLEAQKAAVGRHTATVNGVLIAEFEEVESGSRDDRPQLALALAECRARGAALILAKLDRLARNVAFLLSIVHGAGDAGVVFCDLPQLPPGPAGKFILTMFAAVAELERGLISQRTKAALQAAKARGVRLGSPRLSKGIDAPASHAGRVSQSDRSLRHVHTVMPFLASAYRAGALSFPAMAEALTARGIRPPSGGDRWHPNQVRRIVLKARDHGITVDTYTRDNGRSAKRIRPDSLQVA